MKPFYRSINGLIEQIFKNSLTVVAARPSMGKTSFLLSLALELALKQQKKALFFSLEMSKDALALRLIAIKTGIPLAELRNARLNEADWNKVIHGMQDLSHAGLFIDDSGGITADALAETAEHLKLQNGLDIIFIDYLQMIKSEDNEDIPAKLQQLSNKLKVPVVVSAQLSRSAENRKETDFLPLLSDLNGIEPSADLVLFLHRKHYFDRTEADNLLNVVVAKNRRGEVGILDLKYDTKTLKVSDFEKVKKKSPKKTYTGFERINPLFTFEGFKVNDHNKMAVSAALQIAEKPGDLYNPLYIYGGNNTGKTHLLCAAGNKLRENHPELKIFYLSFNEYVRGYEMNTEDYNFKELRALLKTADVWLLDDFNLYKNLEKENIALFEDLRYFYDNKKQLMVSGHLPLNTIKANSESEERLLTTLTWGLAVELKS